MSAKQKPHCPICLGEMMFTSWPFSEGGHWHCTLCCPKPSTLAAVSDYVDMVANNVVRVERRVQDLIDHLAADAGIDLVRSRTAERLFVAMIAAEKMQGRSVFGANIMIRDLARHCWHAADLLCESEQYDVCDLGVSAAMSPTDGEVSSDSPAY